MRKIRAETVALLLACCFFAVCILGVKIIILRRDLSTARFEISRLERTPPKEIITEKILLAIPHQKGIASWYAHPEHGRKTASGEIFDMYKMTAANSLPFGTEILVTDSTTKLWVRVRVNDRMPAIYKGKRIIDLSYAAAEKLKILEKGLAKVEITILKELK